MTHAPYKKEDSPKEIWLAPQCEGDSDVHNGRTWAEDCPWGETCDECGAPAVRYIRADIAEAPHEVTALVEAARALADDYATISPKYHNTPVYEALRAALIPFNGEK